MGSARISAMPAIPFLQGAPQWLTATISTVVGAAFGFSSSFWLDEIKTRRAETRLRRRLQRAIYTELAMQHTLIKDLVLNAAQATSPQQQEGTAAILKKIRADAYEFAKSQPAIFYELKDAMVIDSLYSHIHHAVAHDKAPSSTTIGVCRLFIQSLEDSVLRGDIDMQSMEQTAPDAYEHFSDVRSKALAAKN
jgi:hypothetical protein